MEFFEIIERCRVNNVFLCEGPRQPQKGSLALTGHHLIFSPSVSTSSPTSHVSDSYVHDQELWVKFVFKKIKSLFIETV